MKKLIVAIITSGFLAMTASSAFAHSGGTDANGCHTNHKTGDYHCHNKKR
ncbi:MULTISPECIES: YHYH domain-containing protein [unclassified Brenneria]|nr:YHYH domain-containing protein [Brenneria sp. hezel4-2-4]MEE3649443.1 YHYH domain-containing protein [Brenneria sp. HEZEL_4_2_4]NPC99399.1 YHYH domain-containing protein [Brenneria sp. hezel4-2-4]